MLGTIFWVMRIVLRSMQLFLATFAFSSDGIAESGFGSNQLLMFEVAHDAQLQEDVIHVG